MNLDRTFCVNSECELKEKCDRHLSHYNDVISDKRWLSVSAFETSAQHNHECYIERIKRNG